MEQINPEEGERKMEQINPEEGERKMEQSLRKAATSKMTLVGALMGLTVGLTAGLCCFGDNHIIAGAVIGVSIGVSAGMGLNYIYIQRNDGSTLMVPINPNQNS